MRALFRKGVKITAIVEATGRSESVVMRAMRGMKRKRPTPDRGDRSKRNDRVLRLAEEGLTRAEIGAKVGLSATQVGFVLAHHPHIAWLLCVRKLKPATVAKRYRMEVSTAERIAMGGTTQTVPRSRRQYW